MNFAIRVINFAGTVLIVGVSVSVSASIKTRQLPMSAFLILNLK
jgi:hypothetical protein